MQRMIDEIGGEPRLEALVNHFYDLIETVPRGRAILEMHLKGHGLNHVRPAQFAFLCGFLGGRRYYQEQNGHMNLREIHAHVDIRREDAEDWLAVMETAMTDTGIEHDQRRPIMNALTRAALSLVNR